MMARTNKKQQGFQLSAGALIFGLLAGVAVGGLVALFTAPRSGAAFRRQINRSVSNTGETLRARVESVVPSDPVAESIAEGKAAARRRRAELGLDEAR